jgi:hypothetical protein
MSNLVNELSDIKEQQKDFKNYCNEENSVFRDINSLKICFYNKKFYFIIK